MLTVFITLPKTTKRAPTCHSFAAARKTEHGCRREVRGRSTSAATCFGEPCRGPRARLQCLGSGLGVTHRCQASFNIFGGPIKVSRKAAERFLQIVLPRRVGQSPSMVRLLAEMRCVVHDHETPLARKSIPSERAAFLARARPARLLAHAGEVVGGGRGVQPRAVSAPIGRHSAIASGS
jgi:hypothetical protein